MANPVIINPSMTLAGQEAAFSADDLGVDLKLTHVSFGRAHYDPNGSEVDLKDPVGSRIPLTGASRPTPYQIRLIVAWSENVGTVPVGEIAFWAGSVLVWVWSKSNGDLAVTKTNGVTYVLFCDLSFTSAPGNSVTFVIDPDGSVALAALANHEGANGAHPQYLLRSQVAQDSGPLAYLINSGGTANALSLMLEDEEALLTELRPGQRFQFLAPHTNTGPVTVEVENLPPISVKRAGNNGLVALEPSDIKAGSMYDLNFDGTYFQLGGGVGSGKAFERFQFEAGIAQTEFSFPHTPGSLIAMRNGREIYDFASNAEGTKITTPPMNLGDRLEFLVFRSFSVADSYTKAEVLALLATAGSVPVGTMLPFPVEVIPPGYLEVDGKLYPDALYPELTAFLGKKYNLPGDPAGFTRKPESRAEFFRGADRGRGVDPSLKVGTYHADQIKKHSHKDTAFVDGVGGAFGAAGVTGATVVPTSTFGKVYGNRTTAGAKGYVETAPGSLGGMIVGLTTGETGGDETRPRALTVMWCIKAWSAPINKGTIDIAALELLTRPATEVALGVAKLATQPLVDAGVDDTTIVTPKKMRFGFQFIKGDNGAIVFPTWLGGFIIQWGVTPLIPNGSFGTFNYTIPFPNAAVLPGAIRQTGGNNSANTSTTLSQITITNRSHYIDQTGSSNSYFFFSFGW